MRPRAFLTGYDPLYGTIRMPSFLKGFLSSPEFARLGGVRLLNCDSLELAALSEARRRSHTLGVLHLATRMPLENFGSEDVRALLYAIVLHDIGTPPFGHTVEYEYIRRGKGDHEGFVERILNVAHHSLGHEHQIGRRTVQLHDEIRATGVEDRIRAILGGEHPLSCILAGDLDVDNVDNVFRVAWYLGLSLDPAVAEKLVAAISIDHRGVKQLGAEHRHLVEEWARLRAEGYKVLFGSPRHRQSQAVLSALVAQAFVPDANGLAVLGDDDDWLRTDEQFMTILRSRRFFDPILKDWDSQVLLPEETFEFETDDSIGRSALMNHRFHLAEVVNAVRNSTYVTLVPYGETVNRRVSFVDPKTGEQWSVGHPERVYRLHVHFGGPRGREFNAMKMRIEGKIEEYADGAGWRIKPRPRAQAA